MTQIDFYFNARDRIRIACRIATKAYRQNLRVLVLVPDNESATSVDQILWTDEPTGFIPHCKTTHTLVMNTPVLIATSAEQSWHEEVLINLTDRPPELFGKFLRLIEIVSLDSSERDLARHRFRFYKERGYEIRNHDLSARGHITQ